MPDFDIFIDDSTAAILGTKENFGSDKIYVFPDFRATRKFTAPNIYHVKTTVSDLKDEDFAIAALEMKVKNLEQDLTTVRQINQTAEREREHLKTTCFLFSLC